MYRADLQKIAGYTVLLRQTVRCVEDSYGRLPKSGQGDGFENR